jgi:hypothetical protein
LRQGWRKSLSDNLRNVEHGQRERLQDKRCALAFMLPWAAGAIGARRGGAACGTAHLPKHTRRRGQAFAPGARMLRCMYIRAP